MTCVKAQRLTRPAIFHLTNRFIDDKSWLMRLPMAGFSKFMARISICLLPSSIFAQLSFTNVGHIPTAGETHGVAVAGHYAYVAEGSSGLRVYDVSNPANAVNVASVHPGGSAYSVAVASNCL